MLAMVLANALFIGNDTLTKLATRTLPPGEIMFVRAVFAFAMIVTLLALNGELRRWRQAALTPLVLARGGMEFPIAFCYITALGVMAIANITAIILIAPLIITALSAIVLGAKVGWRRWMAVLVGFSGMLLVVKPGGGGWGWVALLAVASAVLVALRDTITRRLDSDIPTLVVLSMTIIMTGIFSGFLSFVEVWHMPATAELAALAGAAALMLTGNYFIIEAFRDVDVPIVSPFRYSIIPWALLMGYLVWGDRPDLLSLAGIALIVASGVYTLHRETVRQREAALQAAVE